MFRPDRLLLPAVLLAALAACGDTDRDRPSPVAPARAPMYDDGVPLTVAASGADLTRLRLMVEGGPLDGAREFELEGKEGYPLTGTITLPPGERYAVHATALDAEGRELRAGKGELEVHDGESPEATIEMEPAPGSRWGRVRIGSQRLATPVSSIRLESGEETMIEVELVDARGEVLPIEEGSLTYDLPGWPHELPPIEVKYGDRKAWIAWQHQHVGLVGTLQVCGGVKNRYCLDLDAVAAGTPIQVSAGQDMTCVLRNTGNARCWGSDVNGALGQTRGFSNLAGRDFTRIRVANGSPYGPWSHACAIDRAGAVWCWGRNANGQLGNGTKNGHTDREPVPQRVPLPGAALDVAGGASHTCALLTDGRAYCWGEGALGQLGTGVVGTAWRPTDPGRVDDATTPVPVNTGERFTAIGAGQAHTCALNAAGEAFCWGRNSELQAGVPDAQSTWCRQVGQPAAGCIPVPTLVRGVPTLAGIAAGDLDSCGWTAGGDAWCWGSRVGRVPGPLQSWQPTLPVQIFGATFASLSVGGNFRCGLDASGMGACWGQNNGGQLGSGADSDPVGRPSAGSIAGKAPYSGLDVGYRHACALRTNDARVMCWGSDNTFGTVLGYPHPGSTISATPQLVTVDY